MLHLAAIRDQAGDQAAQEWARIEAHEGSILSLAPDIGLADFLTGGDDNRLCRILGSDPNRSVTDVALGLGFTHTGRFSLHYKQMFGEMPVGA